MATLGPPLLVASEDHVGLDGDELLAQSWPPRCGLPHIERALRHRWPIWATPLRLLRRRCSRVTLSATYHLPPALLARRCVEAVERVGDGDIEQQRGQLLWIEVLGGHIPHLIGHGVGIVGEPGDSFGQGQPSAFLLGEPGVSRHAATVSTCFAVAPLWRACWAPPATQGLQPLI
jgi:hypothetical protein